MTDTALTFQKRPVDVLAFRLGKCWVLVEQVGNKGQVQFGVATDHISRCDELPAAEPIRLLQHVLCPPQVILLLPGMQGTRAVTGQTAAKQMGSPWPLCGAMSQVYIWHQLLIKWRDEAHTPISAAVPSSLLVLLFFLAHMLSNFKAFGTWWFKRSQCAPKWSKPTKDVSIISVNWRVVTRLAASTQLSTHLRCATDTVHALEIKIPGYPDVMGQW